MLSNIQDLLLLQQAKESVDPYQEVLQSITLDGTQYFDTGYYGNTINTSADFRISVDSFDSNSGICGSRNDTTATESSMCILFLKGPVTTSTGTHQNSLRLDWVSGDGTTFTSSLTLGGETTVTCTSNKAVINGTSYTSTGTRNYNQNNPFYIGTVCSGSGTAFTPGLNGKIYVFKIFESGVLVHDYVPVLDSQMRPCLYDKVYKTFLYAKKISDGTTTYDLGFKRWNKYDVDYISSSGTEYITTSIFPDQNTAIECTARIETWGYNPVQYPTYHSTNVFGSGSDGSTDAYTFGIGTPDALTMGRRGGVGITGMNASLNTKYVIYQDKNGASYNDTSLTYSSTPPSVKATTNPLIFFKNPLSAVIGNLSMYGARVWQSNNLILNLKPSVWHNSNTTAIACLYDEVYNKMYTNAGTGSFKAYITNINTTKTNVFTTTGETSGKAINAGGQIINSSASSYSALLPIVGGSVIECVSGNTGNNNYRFHCYDSSGNWIEQSLVLFPEGAGTVEPVTGSFTAPINAKYVRVSYATSASSTIQVKSETETTYEVGKSVSGTPSSSVSGASNCFDTELYGTQDTTVKYIGVAYDSDGTSGQLFGSYDGTQATSQNLTINSTGTSGNTAPIRFDGKVITTPIRIAIDKSVSIINSKYGLWVNDSLHGSWGSVSDFTTTTTLLILKCNNSTNTRNNGCGYCLILEKDEPVAEYIPVKNGSAIGLYDKVSKTVNTGVGTINFNALD